MVCQIKNEYLQVTANTLGAQLASITGSEGTDYLWRGTDAVWENRAPVLFPYVARLTEGKYIYQGKTYYMPIHGFASSMEFECEKNGTEAMIFRLRSSEETLCQYPFAFDFSVEYRLEGKCLIQTYRVENLSGEKMYFGLGAHPGFNVPLEGDLAFEDYCLRFSDGTAPVHIGFSPTCFPDGNDAPFQLCENELKLSHDLFDNDAIVLGETGGRVTLYSLKGSRSVTVAYPETPYLGIWHRPYTKAPYVCLEPWYSLPSRQGIVEDLEQQPGLLSLEPGQIFSSSIVFTFE